MVNYRYFNLSQHFDPSYDLISIPFLFEICWFWFWWIPWLLEKMSNFESKVSTVAPWIGLQNFLKIFSFFTESSVRSTLSFHSHLLTNEKSQSKSTRTISEAVSLYHFFFKHNMLHLDARAVKRFLGCVAFSKWDFLALFIWEPIVDITWHMKLKLSQGLNRNRTVKSEKAIFLFATRHSLPAMVPKKREVVWRNLWATVIMIRLDLDITSDRGYWTCIFSKFDEFVSNPSNHLLSGYNFKFNTTHQSIFWRSANFTSYRQPESKHYSILRVEYGRNGSSRAAWVLAV